MTKVEDEGKPLDNKKRVPTDLDQTEKRNELIEDSRSVVCPRNGYKIKNLRFYWSSPIPDVGFFFFLGRLKSRNYL